MIRAVKKSLLLLPLLAAACRRPEPIRHLSLAGAEMITLGIEARPSRHLPHGSAVSWTIPSSTGGTLELAAGVAPDFPAGATAVNFDIFRVEGEHKEKLIRKAVKAPSPPAWDTFTLPWPPHRRPASLVIEAESYLSGTPTGDPLAAPALLAEPILLPTGRSRTPPRRMVLFLVDTLRADRLGCYGDKLAKTPAFDRLAKEGLTVERVLSAADWTLPAHASLFTSAPVSRHEAGGLRRGLGRELPTLGETLQTRGYRTLAVTGGGFVQPAFGIARGFDRYLCTDPRTENVRVSVQRALELMRAYKDQPFFFFFHTFQVHQYPHELGIHPDKVGDPALLYRMMTDKYRDEVSVTDSAFGDLRKGLAEMGIAAETALLVTSDHGEMLNDRPDAIKTMVYGHSHPYLHDEENRIPLILFDPFHSSRRGPFAGPASILDVAPTVLETLDLPANPAFEGLTLNHLERNPELARNRLLVTEEPHNECLALERAGEKLILRPARPFRALWWGKPYGPIPPLESYDLRKDPGEKADLGSGLPEFEALRAEANWVVGERFPGSLLLSIPSEAAVTYSMSGASGIRQAMLRGARQGDTPPVLDAAGEVHGELSAGASGVWIAVQPNQPKEALRVKLVAPADLGAKLGGGSPVRDGETRLPWSELLQKGSPPKTPLLFYATSLVPGDAKPGGGAALTPETVAQLRSLGYLNMPESEARGVAGAPVSASPRTKGPGVVIIELSRKAGR
jgi:arylsulfatase A-like enzyme